MLRDLPQEVRAVIEHPRCPFCHDQVKPDDNKYGCHECMAWHHTSCWEEGGKCSACGNRWRKDGRGFFSAPMDTFRSGQEEFGSSLIGATCRSCARDYTQHPGMKHCGCETKKQESERLKIKKAALKLCDTISEIEQEHAERDKKGWFAKLIDIFVWPSSGPGSGYPPGRP